MTTEKPSYELTEVTCAKKDCNETFSVLISSIYTVANRPFEDIEFDLLKQNDIAKTNGIDDYIDIKCVCGHNQKVYLEKIA